MKEYFNDIIEKAKRFISNRDLLVFIFFLFISTALWSLQALRKIGEDTIEMPLKYVNLPKDYVITNELPTHLKLTLEGRGTDLIRYHYGSVECLELDLQEIAKGKKAISTTAYHSQIQKKVIEAQIKQIYPENIPVTIEKQKKKTIPVCLDASVDIHQQYTLCDSIQTKPAWVTVYGPQNELNNIDSIHTVHIDLEDIKDTIIKEVSLQPIKNVRYSDSTITIKVFTEKFTEKSTQVPVTPKNVPAGYVLRIFPSSVALNYQVGLSNYENIDASAFALEVDYNEAKKNGKDKLKIKIKRSPKKAFNIKLKSEAVDYIIEEKNTNK